MVLIYNKVYCYILVYYCISVYFIYQYANTFAVQIIRQ